MVVYKAFQYLVFASLIAFVLSTGVALYAQTDFWYAVNVFLVCVTAASLIGLAVCMCIFDEVRHDT